MAAIRASHVVQQNILDRARAQCTVRFELLRQSCAATIRLLWHMPSNLYSATKRQLRKPNFVDTPESHQPQDVQQRHVESGQAADRTASDCLRRWWYYGRVAQPALRAHQSTDVCYQPPQRKDTAVCHDMDVVSEWKMFTILDKLPNTATGLDNLPCSLVPTPIVAALFAARCYA